MCPWTHDRLSRCPETWPPRAPSDRVPLCPFSAQTVVTVGAGDHSWVDRIVRHSSGPVRDGLPARATVSGSSLSPQVSRDLAGSPLGPDFRGPLPRAWATPTPKHCRTAPERPLPLGPATPQTCHDSQYRSRERNVILPRMSLTCCDRVFGGKVKTFLFPPNKRSDLVNLTVTFSKSSLDQQWTAWSFA